MNALKLSSIFLYLGLANAAALLPRVSGSPVSSVASGPSPSASSVGSNSFTITLNGDWGQNNPTTYGYFQAPPNVSSPDGQPTTYSNLWFKQKVALNGTGNVQFTASYYAFTGTSPSSPAPGVTISSSMVLSVTLGVAGSPGTNGSSINMTVSDGIPSIQAVTATAGPMCFSIHTQAGTFDPSDNFLIGIAQQDPTTSITHIVPVSVFLADPGATYTICPLINIYMSTGTFTQDTMVSIGEQSDTGDCNYNAVGATSNCEITHADDGTWPVVWN
ncbi:MAG: hypothetical protein MMC33_009419 [Icmadophila ericetorum]|nr:hypothetical protein [Icmadophila ericetorum]